MYTHIHISTFLLDRLETYHGSKTNLRRPKNGAGKVKILKNQTFDVHTNQCLPHPTKM